MTVRPSGPDGSLPHLIAKSQRAVELEADALKAALDEYADLEPRRGCLYETDLAAARQAGSRVRKAQRNLLAWGQYQARLMLVNAYDHLVSMGRLLGDDGAMSLYAHTTLSRSVCEAAVRHAWLLDSSVTYHVRLTRGAAALFYNVENRLKGAKDASTHGMDARIGQILIDNCAGDYTKMCALLDRAGMNLGLDHKGKKVVRIELRDSAVSVPIKLDIGPLMAALLPESPGWYLVSSGIAHSAGWLLHGAVTGETLGPSLALTPDLMEVAAAAESAISAAALVIDRHATYFGFDSEKRLGQSRQRRGMLDALMRQQAANQAVMRTASSSP